MTIPPTILPMWLPNLALWSAQVALLTLAAALLVALFRIREPRVVLIHWRALLIICLLLPVLQPWHPAPSAPAARTASPDVVFSSVPPAPGPAPASQWHLPGLTMVVGLCGAVLLLGIAVRFGILALGLVKLRQLRRASWPVPAGATCSTALEQARAQASARAEFRFSAKVDSPVTFGIAAPIILLPERFAALEPQFQASIACHELLHVRRCDWAHHLAEEILRCTFWFHPSVLWMIGRVRLAREQVVDLEVVRLTHARKPYLEALLEFTTGRTRAAAIPAPPFLIERQFAARVSLMLKEVRMSRVRLIASLTAIVGALALCAVCAVWAFPLKAAPRPQAAVDQGTHPNALIHPVAEVSLHVSVLDERGNFVGDLPASAFRVYEDGIEGKVTHAELKGGDHYALAYVPTNPRRDGSFQTIRVSVKQRGYGKLTASVTGGNLLTPGGPADGITGGVAGSVPGGISSGTMHGVATAPSGGVSGGASGGVSGEVRSMPSAAVADEPTVSASTIWTDKVRRGHLQLGFRALGTLLRADDPANLIARVMVPESEITSVKLGQSANVDTRKGIVAGRVSRIAPSASRDNGTVAVDIALELPLADSAAGWPVDASIATGELDNVLFVGRPAHAAENSEFSIFRILSNGTEAEQVKVRFGEAGVNTIAVLSGLNEGDTVVLSDMSRFEKFDRVRISKNP